MYDAKFHDDSAMQHAAAQEWDKALDHARRVPKSWDIYQRLPSIHPEGMPDEAVHKVLDHMGPKHENLQTFLQEYAWNLPKKISPELLGRVANLSKDSYLPTNLFLNHPDYKPDDETKRLALAGELWNGYEKEVNPHHFAAIQSLMTGKHEVVPDFRGGEDGDSHTHSDAIPHLREYAKKAQEAVMNDHEWIPKRYFKGEPYIRVHRGVAGHYGKALHDAAKFDHKTKEVDNKHLIVPTASMSSWSLNPEQAQRFVNIRNDMPGHPKGYGVVISKWMPVKHILHTGFHNIYPGQPHAHPDEQEIIFQHPKGKMRVSTKEMKFETHGANDDYPDMETPKLRPKKEIEVSSQPLEKGMKDKLVSLATAASMLGYSMPTTTTDYNPAPPAPRAVASQPVVKPHPDLKPIDFIESSNGKNFNHAMVNYGVNKGTAAIGHYGLMPVQVQDTVSHDKALSNKYPELLSYDPKTDSGKIKDFLMGNVNVQHDIANSHWKRLRNHFNNNMSRMVYAWKNGITGADEASDQEIQEHPYVKQYFKMQKMLKLEHPHQQKEPMHKSQDLDEKVNHIKKFLPSDQSLRQFGIEISELIQAGAVQNLSNEGHFTHSSFVVGNQHDQAWLLKLESENKPAIQSAQYGLQSVKETGFYEAAKRIFNLGEFIPTAILGEVEKAKPNSLNEFEFIPAVAIKMLPESFKLAADIEEERPGVIDGMLEKYRRQGTLHKLGAMLIILGEADAHGRNMMTDGQKLVLIDHGTSFADENFNPAQDHKIFVPYFLRVSRLKSGMSKEQKLDNMAQIDDPNTVDEVRSWILALNEDELFKLIESYGLEAKPCVDRLTKLKQQVTTLPADQVINRFWILGFPDSSVNTTA